MNSLAVLAIISEVLSLLCLLVLHVVSPEFKPNWRLISEYAFGKHKWLITWFFIFWGTGSILLALLLFGVVTGTWVTVGVVLLFISGIGEIMGGLFDAKHKYHGLAFGLGVPTLPVASLLIGYHLLGAPGSVKEPLLLFSSHLPWISVLLMAGSMMVMFSGFKKAGVPMGKDAPVPEKVPEGVVAVAGYANRLLVVSYLWWVVVIAYMYL
jgi:hypothetical protein